MNTVKKSDNEKTYFEPKGTLVLGDKKTPVISFGGRPKDYKSISLLEGGILEEAKGNRLRIKKDGSSKDYYIHECFDALFLTEYPYEKNEEIMIFGKAAQKKTEPFKELIGKKITYIKKQYFSLEDKEKDLPWLVEICAKDSKYTYELTSCDGGIIGREKVSQKHMIERIYEMTMEDKVKNEDKSFSLSLHSTQSAEKYSAHEGYNVDKALTEENIKEIKRKLNNNSLSLSVHVSNPLTSIQHMNETMNIKEIEKEMPFPIFNEDVLKENPELYSKLRE